jgi:hypothetical protein
MTGKLPKCPSIGEWSNKLWYVQIINAAQLSKY